MENLKITNPMRSQRLLKGNSVSKPMRGITVDTNLRFSLFEFMNVTPMRDSDTPEGADKPAIKFTVMDEYTSTLTSGLTGVQDFSEEIKYKRRECLKAEGSVSFATDLAYDIKEVGTSTSEKDYKCVRLVFRYETDSNQVRKEAVDIIVFAESKNPASGIQKYQLTVKDLNLDSDVTEYLFRFTKGLTWGSETYAILDCNPNLAVNKGIYLTLNVPFESNIAWGVEKRKLIKAYRFFTPASN